ncbi:XRE family transcriptional regulator [Tsukamurella sp. NPDC003166]|uniref:helix-turn-helix domain-containing protein n=1 Tax=Tsukamurella sp. NPDC003166 TaxID=3154444 RepID=UPI0033B2B5D2
MDLAMRELGDRIRSRMPEGMSQRGLAELVGMKPDALSRALNGQRGISSLEVAAIADVIGADTHWIITGREVPNRVTIAARHAWNPTTRQRINDGREADAAVLDKIAEVYRQAFPDGAEPSAALPTDPAEARDRLGPGFVEPFAERLESRLGVDVIRIPGLSTDYSLRIGDRAVIVLMSTPNWFRNNWSAAHELAHLAFGHHGDDSETVGRNEDVSDAFAAELLLPESDMRSIVWREMPLPDVARQIWSRGVSTSALATRLTWLKLADRDLIDALRSTTTPQFLRAHLEEARTDRFLIRRRGERSVGRLFPEELLGVLEERVAAGDVAPDLLAWAQDVDTEEIDYPDDETYEALAASRYQAAIADRPSLAELRAIAAEIRARE